MVALKVVTAALLIVFAALTAAPSPTVRHAVARELVFVALVSAALAVVILGG